jgi:ADP-ribosyl-[dinitrogen reductase] hydrolase
VVEGYCFDIGLSTRSALSWYDQRRGGQFVQDDQAAGNGVLMRLAPIPMMYFKEDDAIVTVGKCAFQSIMTHPSSQSIETSMLLGVILNNIFSGERNKSNIVNYYSFNENTQDVYEELCEKYSCKENVRIDGIKEVEYHGLDHDKISGSGYCVHTLEAALWAFVSTDSFMSGLKKVVSLGEDTDTTGAVYGQIAGAYYGLKQIPHRDKITWSDKIHNLAERLYELNATTVRKVSKEDILKMIAEESEYTLGEYYEGKGIYTGVFDEYPYRVDYFNRLHRFRVPTNERGKPSIINTVLIKKIKREDV